MPYTNLSWEDYRAQGDKLKADGLTPKQIKEKLGDPRFNGTDYHIESNGKGGIKRKNFDVRKNGKAKSNGVRATRAQPKTNGEASYRNGMQKQARSFSQSTLHQHAANGIPTIAEHDVRIASGGTNEHMSLSDPKFKVFKDTIEGRLPSEYIADIDDISGGVRVIPKSHHNKFQRTSQQLGATFEMGMDNKGALSRLKAISKRLKIPFVAGLVSAGLDFASTGNPASAAGAFVDAENPIDGGPVANGTLAANTPENFAARRQQIQQERTAMKQGIKQGIMNVMDFLILR
tara:strand:- start:46 stop:912 length:867 start_codon:yes stop_codon:yes gene_type:complete